MSLAPTLEQIDEEEVTNEIARITIAIAVASGRRTPRGGRRRGRRDLRLERHVPEMKTTEPYSPSERAKASANPVMRPA